jgi:hypothetical protein
VVLEAAAGAEPELVVDELVELDPQAARPKMAAIATATVLMRLLTLSPSLVARSLGALSPHGVNQL